MGFVSMEGVGEGGGLGWKKGLVLGWLLEFSGYRGYCKGIINFGDTHATRKSLQSIKILVDFGVIFYLVGI